MFYKQNRGIPCQHFPFLHDATAQNADIQISYCTEGERKLPPQNPCKNVAVLGLVTPNYDPTSHTLQLLLIHAGT